MQILLMMMVMVMMMMMMVESEEHTELQQFISWDPYTSPKRMVAGHVWVIRKKWGRDTVQLSAW